MFTNTHRRYSSIAGSALIPSNGASRAAVEAAGTNAYSNHGEVTSQVKKPEGSVRSTEYLFKDKNAELTQLPEIHHRMGKEFAVFARHSLTGFRNHDIVCQS